MPHSAPVLQSAQACEAFNALPWHDSQLLRVTIEHRNESGAYRHDVFLHVLLEYAQGTFRPATIVIRDCRLFRADLDLLGKSMAGNAIGGAHCSASSARRSQLIAEIVDGFTLFPMEASALVGQLYFVCGLISPGGKIEILGTGLQVEIDPTPTR